MIYFCDRISVGISALVDGEDIGPDGLDAASIEAHVRACSYCSAERRRLERARDLVADEGGVEPPERLWTSIESTLRSEGIIES